jgi:hypothetical protein
MGSPPPLFAYPDSDADLAQRLRFQGEACRGLGSPLYAGLLNRLAADVEEQGPSWAILRGHERDPGPSALALRLMGAVNRLVLGGAAPALAAAYRDRDRDGAATWREFRALLEREVDRLRQLVNLPVQTNEVGRCAALLPGFLAVAASTGLPLRLLEVGASGGLNLNWDRYGYLAAEVSWGQPGFAVEIAFALSGEGRLPAVREVEIAERRGCDAAPIDPTSAEGLTSLLAYVWPDQLERVERVRSAVAVAAEHPVTVERAGAAAWVERELGRSAPGRATVLFHSIVEQYLSEEELTSFHRLVRAAGERANAAAPLAWLRMEPAGELAEVRLTTWPSGEDRRLALAGYHGTPVELVA